jgi:hypothetical protein
MNIKTIHQLFANFTILFQMNSVLLWHPESAWHRPHTQHQVTKVEKNYEKFCSALSFAAKVL